MRRWTTRVLESIERLASMPSRGELVAPTGGEPRESLYAAAVHSSHLAFLTTDTHGKITGWNPGAERLFGYTAEEAIGCDIEMTVPAERLHEIAQIRARFCAGERLNNFRTVRLAKGRKPVYVVFDISPLHAPDGELIGSSSIVRDVTEQQLAEELFELAVEACPSGMMIVDRSGRIVMVNGEFENLFGYGRDELVNRTIEMLVPPRLRRMHVNLRAEFNKSPQARNVKKGRELVGLHKDGSEFPVEIGLNPIHIREGLLILAVVTDITERKQAERMKDEFVATVSHELRTPLTSMTASLALLVSGRTGALPDSAARLLNIAHSNGLRLGRLVNDILDIEKIESGKATFQAERVRTRAVVEQAIEASRNYAEQFGVQVRLDAGSIEGDVWADGDRLAQVVTNLISNAIKFSPRGETVVIGVGRRKDFVRITVRDHGPGIADEFKPRVFESFAQADNTDARQKGGTGLGLSIVKQIVKRLGGEVGFESERGCGALFFVELPSWAATEHVPAEPGAGGDGEDEVDRGTGNRKEIA